MSDGFYCSDGAGFSGEGLGDKANGECIVSLGGVELRCAE
jgi:hypothetical protein